MPSSTRSWKWWNGCGTDSRENYCLTIGSDIFVHGPSLSVFNGMRRDPHSIEAQKLRVESAETYGNFVTVKREP
jgi:hypothetical protein